MLHSAGKDPLTWSFAKLFAHHVTQQLGTFEGVPSSHAWRWQRGGLWRARLLTKAQVVGVLVSVHERAERVEFLVDDGTALVKAVRWSAVGWDRRVALGDLVLVQGKLSVDRTHDSGEREIRVVHIARVDDPNEELLHWVHVMELARGVYSADLSSSSSSADSKPHGVASLAPSRTSHWDQIAAHAFFDLAVDTQAKTRFLERTSAEAHDALLVETLEALVHKQQQQQQQPPLEGDASRGSDSLAVRVTFVDTLKRISHHHQQQREEGEGSRTEDVDAQIVVRRLRRTFAALRSSGLLFLEDTDADRHMLLSFEFALAPALLQHLRDTGSSGQSVAELTEWTVTQRKFQRLPLQWLEISLQRLLRSGRVTQREDSQRFHVTDA